MKGLEDLIGGFLKNKNNYFIFPKELDTVIIVSGKDLNGDFAADLFAYISERTDIRFSAAVGNNVENILRIGESCIEAKRKISQRFYSNRSALFVRTDNESKSYPDMVIPIYQRLAEGIKDGFDMEDTDMIVKSVNEAVLSLSEKKMDQADALSVFTKAYVKAESESVNLREGISLAYPDGISYINWLRSFDTLDEIAGYTHEYYRDAALAIFCSEKNRNEKIINLVKEYITKHYREEITLNILSEIAFVSPNYLSEVFKCRTGENYVDYITRVRIENAKRLLHDQGIKTYQAGQMVGYEDPSYFSKVFKKIVGISPKEYKNSIG